MRDLRHLAGVATLAYDPARCVGCGACVEVCPQGVLRLEDRRAVVQDRDGCMECGACAHNCPSQALTVRAGVGCMAHLVANWRGKPTSCC